RMVQVGGASKLQSDELEADERLTLELSPPDNKDARIGSVELSGASEQAQQFELKRAVATGRKVKLTANEDGLGNGLQAEGIEFICDNLAHEARLRGRDQVVATMAQYDIEAQGIIKILLPTREDEDKDPRGLIIQGPGEIKLRASAQQPDPYTLASWQKELQWHRLQEEHRIELYGNAVLTHEKMGRMAGEQVKAWLHQEQKKNENAASPSAGTMALTGMDRLDALKRVEVDRRVSVVSARFVVPSADRLTLNFSTASADFLQQKSTPSSEDGFDSTPGEVPSPMLGKPENKSATSTSQPFYVHAGEIDGEILLIGNKQQMLRRLEARERVHIERKPEPGKQNGLNIQGQRVELTLQGVSELYRCKLFGNKATIQTEKFGLEGQVIDLDQTENLVQVPGPGKFHFMSDRDFQGNAMNQAEEVTIRWSTSM
ncbi:MAG TPA: hypothetical protein PKD72_13450, partial [Gemmatales bacterium]|nr:hypothetical protein [Gemmatales bacterium]